MPRSPKDPKESEIQHAIMEWLFWKHKEGKLFYWRQNVLPVPISRNGRITGFRPGGAKGSADIFCVIAPHGNLIGIEVKNSTGKQSPDQIIFQQQLQAVGAEYYVVRSVDDVERVLHLST